MIKSITVTNYVGDEAKIVLTQDLPSHGFLLTKADGLGPAKANINLSDLATLDGGTYNSAILDTRNITLELVFANIDIETARHNTYKYFPIKKNIELIVETDERRLRTTGWIESNEPDIFSDQEGCKISIICPYPFFYSAEGDGTNTTIFYGTEPLFEFVYSNESLTEKLTEFGNVQFKRENTIVYNGDSEIGVVITINAIDTVSGVIYIYNTGTREMMSIDIAKVCNIANLNTQSLSLGDEIIISTLTGEKTVRFLHEGVYYNVLNALSRYADWFTLSKGNNTFAYTVDQGAENLYFKMTYPIIYEGV